MLLEFESWGGGVPGLLLVVKGGGEILGVNNDSDEDEHGEGEARDLSLSPELI